MLPARQASGALSSGLIRRLGIDHVRGGKFLAAAELHVIAQLEGIELAVEADGPRLREVGDGRLCRPSPSPPAYPGTC